MKSLFLRLSFLLLVFSITPVFASNGDGERDFEVVQHEIVMGDVVFIGNTVLCPKESNGECKDDGNINNANADLKIINDSSADLTIPLSDYEIKWAGIFWMGVALEANSEAGAINNFNYVDSKKIDITAPNNTTYSPTWNSANGSKFDTYTKRNGRWFLTYQAYIDITDVVKAGGEGTYKINNLYTTEGDTSNPDGNFGAWMIAVIYDDNTNQAKPKDISIFNGFKAVLDKTGDPFTIEGFFTPRENDVYSKMTIFTAEGDKLFGGESLLINPHNDGSNTYFPVVYEGGNINNVFVSGISLPNGYPGELTRDPSLQYNYAIDLHTIEIGNNVDSNYKLIGNLETGMDVKIETVNDSFYASTVAVSTEIYEPQFCYDYAYSQNDTTFTEENDGTKDPKISGTALVGVPIEVTLYLKNMIDSDLLVKDMNVSILDINSSQITYARDTTEIAKNGELYPISKTDVGWGTTVSDTYIKNIPIGTQVNSDYFYVYYNLDPIITDIDDNLNVEVNYNLILNSGVEIPYSLTLGSQLPMCSTSNFKYTPTKGIFNVVHKPTFDNNGKYNIPTQVTNREGNFSIISIDSDFTDTVDNLENTSTYVQLQIIDVDGFHLTDASCHEVDSAITDKIWIRFKDNNQVEFVSGDTDAFYGTARRNTAFRITYNALNDDGDSLTIVEGEDGTFKIKEFPDYAGSKCNEQYSSENIVTVCESAAGSNTNFSNGLSEQGLQDCMECIFGKLSRFVCSRDNFAIRPEALMFKINDQNQTSFSSKTRIYDDVSGVVTPSGNTANLASGYQYILEMTGVNHKTNTASNGYIKTFSDAFVDDNLIYEWTEPTAVICNDENSSEPKTYIYNGYVEQNTSLDEVGIYTLSAIDKTWTLVDSDPAYRSHHDIDTYLQGSSTLDCSAGSSTIAEGATGMNGCDISSNHDSSGSSLKYRNYNIEFHPYKFNMNTISASYGENNSTIWPTTPYIYMADMSINSSQVMNDHLMSFHLNGFIGAVGENNSILSNFVTGCYAKPIELKIDKVHNTTPIASTYSYIFDNRDINDTNTTGYPINIDVNETALTINIAANDFTEDLNGWLNTLLYLNFDRNQTIVANPETITYNSYTSNCLNDVDCTMNADLSTSFVTKDGNATGALPAPLTIQHYYGRSYAMHNRYIDPDDQEALIYYEVYCNGTINGNPCDPLLLQDGTDSNSTDDPRWFINTNHLLDGGITSTYGVAGNVKQKGFTVLSPGPVQQDTSTFTNPNGNHQDFVILDYDETRGYPYKTTMEMNSSNWLIYNKYNNTKNVNEFTVEFRKATGDWAGISETNTTTKDDQTTQRTNRRTMW